MGEIAYSLASRGADIELPSLIWPYQKQEKPDRDPVEVAKELAEHQQRWSNWERERRDGTNSIEDIDSGRSGDGNTTP